MMRFLVVGGGAAGWLAALTIKKINPEYNVELIESEEIGVLGAGESTTAAFKILINHLEIDQKEFIRETEATIKSSLRFDNWSEENKTYYSLFAPWFKGKITKDQIPDYLVYCYANDIDVNKTGLYKFTSENKAPIIQIDSETTSIQGYTYHINAKLTAKYLRKVAERRGVIRHEGKVVKINGHYPIVSVEDNRGRIHEADFFFDCSGFARLIIGKHFRTNWTDFTKHLTVNSTIPFFIPPDKEIPPYTHAIAMKYGWMFKVPTQKRYGSGYIYDDNFISKEEAIVEVQEKLGYNIELVNFFQFKSGRYEDLFVSNCIALGLSSGFLEPMAATNMGNACAALTHMLLNKFNFNQRNRQFINKFNHMMKIHDEYANITEIFSHYVNLRKDTKFWERYNNPENYPSAFKNAFNESFGGDKFDFRLFSQMTNFTCHTAITKFIGNNLFKDKAIKYCEKYRINEKFKPIHEMIQSETIRLQPNVLDHRDYLEKICKSD